MAKKRKQLAPGAKGGLGKRGGNRIDKPSLPTAPWDFGADGPANKAREYVEEDGAEPEVNADTGKVVNANPNKIKRVRFKDMLEVYAGRNWITARGYEAGKKLRRAWLETERGKGMDFSADKVDASPKPDAHIEITIDRISKLVRITRVIPWQDKRILYVVACEGSAIASLPEFRGRHHDAGKLRMHDALERLADNLRM